MIALNLISNVRFSLQTLMSIFSLGASLYFSHKVFGFNGLHVANIMPNRFLICTGKEINSTSRYVSSKCCSPSSKPNFWQASLNVWHTSPFTILSSTKDQGSWGEWRSFLRKEYLALLGWTVYLGLILWLLSIHLLAYVPLLF